nr:unnamed protein product [Callosobruchus analis]
MVVMRYPSTNALCTERLLSQYTEHVEQVSGLGEIRSRRGQCFIYYNLPGANADPSEDIDVFEIALQKLDEYFLPKQSLVYERHIFRLIKQGENEKFEKFLMRLRNQADKCKIDNPEEHLIDQITEKCSLVELRKKILTIGDDITLEKIIMEASTLEVVNHQLEE